jgi:tRNA threonylcarbamoyladenosine biosynthesis protein TsaE|tara:strand:+ start:620 stop:1054 length:435 start_codon:yes stop_codon:yes gene_type:complete
MTTHKINSLDDLKKFARSLSKNLKGGDVVALSGELGAGKTTLVQMVAEELGVYERVTSPTFTVLKTHDIPATQQKKFGFKQLCHIDLYRLEAAEKGIGFEEYFGDTDAVCFIEWAQKAKQIIPKQALWIELVVVDKNKRQIKVS